MHSNSVRTYLTSYSPPAFPSHATNSFTQIHHVHLPKFHRPRRRLHLHRPPLPHPRPSPLCPLLSLPILSERDWGFVCSCMCSAIPPSLLPPAPIILRFVGSGTVVLTAASQNGFFEPSNVEFLTDETKAEVIATPTLSGTPQEMVRCKECKVCVYSYVSSIVYLPM